MSSKQDLRTHINLLDAKEKLHRITKSVTSADGGYCRQHGSGLKAKFYERYRVNI